MLLGEVHHLRYPARTGFPYARIEVAQHRELPFRHRVEQMQEGKGGVEALGAGQGQCFLYQRVVFGKMIFCRRNHPLQV